MENSFKLRSGFTVKVDLTDNLSQIHYQIIDPTGELVFTTVDGVPASLSERGKTLKTIKEYLTDSKQLRRVRQKLQHIVSDLQHELEMKEVEEQQKRDFEIRKKVHDAKKILKEIENPLLYIGTIVDWLTAGERINVLLCFTAGCSQIILRKPISVIGYGESASGKTHVENVALSFFLPEHIINEKQVSPAALFNRSKTDEYFYDGKIVVYGDMGGEKDKENQQESFDLMKELQSDGKLSKPVSVKTDNAWETVDLELKGTPCLWYTTVPQDIDNQELSRAILFTPRTDNQDIFNKRGKALSYEMGKTYDKYLEVQKMAETIPYMVEHLRNELEDCVIINPFFDVISTMLRGSRFYKRDTEKYVNLLKTITALNYYHREIYIFKDGKKGIITSSEDVSILLSLLEPYKTSIANNIKPKSAEIYKKLVSKVTETETFADSLKFGDDVEEWNAGFTTRDYFEKSGTDLSLQSIRKYFSELNQSGLLKVTGKERNTNYYDVVTTDLHDDFKDYEIDYDFIEYELGFEIADIIRKDSVKPEINIMDKDNNVGGTPWKSM